MMYSFINERISDINDLPTGQSIYNEANEDDYDIYETKNKTTIFIKSVLRRKYIDFIINNNSKDKTYWNGKENIQYTLLNFEQQVDQFKIEYPSYNIDYFVEEIINPECIKNKYPNCIIKKVK